MRPEPISRLRIGDWAALAVLGLCMAVLAAPALMLIYECGRWVLGEEGGPARLDAGPAVVLAAPDVKLDLPEGLPPDVRAAARRTVPILIVYRNHAARQGSGFLYRDRTVITAAHLTTGVDEQHVRTWVWCQSGMKPGRILYRNEVRDTMIIRAACPAEPLQTGCLSEDPADPVYVSGFEFGPSRQAARYVKKTGAVPFVTLRPDHLELAKHPILLWRVLSMLY